MTTTGAPGVRNAGQGQGQTSQQRKQSTVTYDRVRDVISQLPDRRKDFEVNSILPWFRTLKDTKVLGQLKTSILFDVLKNVQFLSKQRDELIIRQGDQGDCMYILLRGQVTIYHNYGVTSDGTGEDGDAAVARSVATVSGDALRQQLGAFVVTLRAPGSSFGEVALLSDNGTRSASVIADEPSTDLIVIDRALYNRSVQQVVRREFEQKANFIRQHPHFRTWQGKYLKQLTMALEKEIYSYEHIVTRQAAHVDAIYFIISGEVKIVMDPVAHQTQYPKLLPPQSTNQNIADALRPYNNRLNDDSPRMMNRKISKRQQPVEICLLGVNEAIGDIETLMGLSTYMQTSICTQDCELLVLDMKHYDRLFIRRNPRTIDRMKDELELRIKSRIATSFLPMNVPLLDCLIKKAADFSTKPKTSLKLESENGSGRRANSVSNKCGGNADGKFIPVQGALMDQYGPGTVFFHIRQNREKNAKISIARASIGQRQSTFAQPPQNFNNNTDSRNNDSGVELRRDDRTVYSSIDRNGIETSNGFKGNGLVTVDVDSGYGMSDAPLTSTLQTGIASTSIAYGGTRTPSHSARNRTTQQLPHVDSLSDAGVSADDSEALDDLENRLRDWMMDECTSGKVDEQPSSGLLQKRQFDKRSGLKPRISRLHRASTEVDQLKPGAKIIMRQRKVKVQSYDYMREPSSKTNGKRWSESELNYYRKALTEPVPVFVSPIKISR